MSTVRLRRLTADYQRLQEYVRSHPRVKLLQVEGDPPERYRLEYRIRSLRMVDGELQPVKDHTVEIALPRNYPRTPPQCRALSPVFHPNIAPHAICVGDHWGAGESLQSIVIRIGEMLAFQSYNVKSPLNGEAARWVEENKVKLPLDPVSLLVEEQTAAVTEPAAPPRTITRARTPRETSAPAVVAPPAEPETIRLKCPACEAVYRIPAGLQGKKVRCKMCQHVFEASLSTAGGVPGGD